MTPAQLVEGRRLATDPILDTSIMADIPTQERRVKAQNKRNSWLAANALALLEIAEAAREVVAEEDTPDIAASNDRFRKAMSRLRAALEGK